MKVLIVTLLLAVAVGGLLFEQAVGISRDPIVSKVTPTTISTGKEVITPASNSIQFHTIMFVYSNVGVGWPAGFWSLGNRTSDVNVYGNIVPEINDQQTWSAFYYNIMACGWPPGSIYCPPLPQVDFNTRTVLLVSQGRSTWGEGFNLSQVVRVSPNPNYSYNDFNLTRKLGSVEHLQLEGVAIGLRQGCYYIELVVTPVLIIDIPKTQLPAELSYSAAQGPSCLGNAN